jgi:hypothetical protein
LLQQLVVDQIEDGNHPGGGAAVVQAGGRPAVRVQGQTEGAAGLSDHVTYRGDELVGVHQVRAICLRTYGLVTERCAAEESFSSGHGATGSDDSQRRRHRHYRPTELLPDHGLDPHPRKVGLHATVTAGV